MTLPGWKEQIEKAGAQAWTLSFSEKEFDFTPDGTYQGMDSTDEEYSSDEEEKTYLGFKDIREVEERNTAVSETKIDSKMDDDESCNPLGSFIDKLATKQPL